MLHVCPLPPCQNYAVIFIARRFSPHIFLNLDFRPHVNHLNRGVVGRGGAMGGAIFRFVCSNNAMVSRTREMFWLPAIQIRSR